MTETETPGPRTNPPGSPLVPMLALALLTIGCGGRSPAVDGEDLATNLAVGVALGSALNNLPTLKGFVRLTFSAGLFGQALGTALVLGVAGGVYPAWRASRARRPRSSTTSPG